MKIAVTGRRGRLGKALLKLGAIPMEVDIRSRASIKRSVSEVNPDVVIHCAAYTDVAKAEVEREKCWKVNVDGTQNLLKEYSGKIIFMSTAYVFDGNLPKGRFYTETDATAAKGHYAYSKQCAESLVMEKDSNNLSLRIVSLYGDERKLDPVSKIIRNLQGEDKTTWNAFFPSRLIRNFTYVPTLAKTIMEHTLGLSGILNLGDYPAMNYWQLAMMIADIWGLDSSWIAALEDIEHKIVPEYQPENVAMDFSKAQELNIPIYFVEENLHKLKGTKR